jgi:hypothetical protein
MREYLREKKHAFKVLAVLLDYVVNLGANNDVMVWCGLLPAGTKIMANTIKMTF